MPTHSVSCAQGPFLAAQRSYLLTPLFEITVEMTPVESIYWAIMELLNTLARIVFVLMVPDAMRSGQVHVTLTNDRAHPPPGSVRPIGPSKP